MMACEDHDRQCQLQQQTLLEGLTIPSHHVDVDRTQALGRGSFGVAFRATYISTQVAVKELLTPALSAKVREELAREVSALKNSHHPNIIRFYGLIKDSQSGLMSIVIEYASLGSLFDFYLATPKSEVPLDSRIHLLFQTAAGLCYLHDVLHILHRDVKSPNVLLSRDTETQGLVAKISDFGLATLKNESAILSQDVKPVGTLLWMAPETVDALASKTTRKSDVFAFAVLMTEVLGWVGVYGLPWQSMPRPNIVVSTVCDPDRRSAIVERMGQTVFKHSPSGLITLFEKCWDLDPDVRPEFSSVMESLKDILNVMEQSSPSPGRLIFLGSGAGQARNSGIMAANLSSMDMFDFAGTEPILEAVNPVRYSGEFSNQEGSLADSLDFVEYAKSGNPMDKLDRERVAIRHRRRGNVAARSHLAGPLLSPYNSTVLRVPPSFFTAPSKPSSTAPPAVPQMPPVPPPYTTQPQSSGIGSLVPAELAAREFWARNFGSESMPVPMAQLLQAMMETMEPNAAVRWTEAIQRRLSVMLGRRSVDGDEVANDDRSDWFGSLRRLRGSAASRTGTARSSVSRWRYALTNTHEEKAKRPLEESIDTVSIHEFTTMMELRGDETVSEMVKSFASAAESLAHVEEPREGGKGALFSQGRKTVRKKDSDRSLRSVASFVAEGNEDEKGADISTTAIALPAESIATEGLGVSSGPTPATMFAEAAAHLARESFDEARDLLLQTAHHHNHAESMFLLGHMWETGRGVPAPDADASRGWYRKAGNAGYEKAFDRLRDLNAKAFPFLRPMRDGEEHISIDEFLDEKMSVALADEIASNTATKSLRYTAEKSTGQASKPNFAALAQALQKNKTLTELQLRGIRISNQSAEALAAALSEHPSLKVLDLSDNRIGSDGSRAISQALSKNKSNISSLNLSGNAIGNTGAEDLAEMLTKCETLEELHLSLNMISDIGASAIGKALPKSSLKRLVLSENHIGDAGAKEVARGLEIGSRLTSLDLSANWIGTVGAASIAKSLNENSRLQNLELGRNKLGDAGAKAFAESLVTNENLMSLDLSHNKIGDSGGKALAEMITRNNSLILLILAENHMTGIDVCGYGYGVTNTLKRVARERKMTVQVKQASPKQGIFGWICGCLRV